MARLLLSSYNRPIPMSLSVRLNDLILLFFGLTLSFIPTIVMSQTVQTYCHIDDVQLLSDAPVYNRLIRTPTTVQVAERRRLSAHSQYPFTLSRTLKGRILGAWSSPNFANRDRIVLIDELSANLSDITSETTRTTLLPSASHPITDVINMTGDEFIPAHAPALETQTASLLLDLATLNNQITSIQNDESNVRRLIQAQFDITRRKRELKTLLDGLSIVSTYLGIESTHLNLNLIRLNASNIGSSWTIRPVQYAISFIDNIKRIAGEGFSDEDIDDIPYNRNIPTELVETIIERSAQIDRLVGGYEQTAYEHDLERLKGIERQIDLLDARKVMLTAELLEYVAAIVGLRYPCTQCLIDTVDFGLGTSRYEQGDVLGRMATNLSVWRFVYERLDRVTEEDRDLTNIVLVWGSIGSAEIEVVSPPYGYAAFIKENRGAMIAPGTAVIDRSTGAFEATVNIENLSQDSRDRIVEDYVDRVNRMNEPVSNVTNLQRAYNGPRIYRSSPDGRCQ